MTITRPSRIAVAAVIAPLAFLATACGDDDSSKSDAASDPTSADSEPTDTPSSDPTEASESPTTAPPAGGIDYVVDGVWHQADGDEVALPLSVVQEHELELTGTFRYANTWPTAIDLVTSGRVDLDRLVTGTYDLADAALALTAGRRDETAVKAVVRPGR